MRLSDRSERLMTTPLCPRCRRTDVDEEEQTGSSKRWFVCNWCGHRFAASSLAIAN
jgi:hypothetical protein